VRDWPSPIHKKGEKAMTDLDLGAFGQFTIYENGFYEETHNDGRYVRHEEEPEWWAYKNAPAAHEGFALYNKNCPQGGDYGWIFGENLADCLESYFNILTEGGWAPKHEDD
jgi:hypothetical protein